MLGQWLRAKGTLEASEVIKDLMLAGIEDLDHARDVVSPINALMTAFKLTKHTGRLPVFLHDEKSPICSKRHDGRIFSHLRPGGSGDNGGASWRSNDRRRETILLSLRECWGDRLDDVIGYVGLGMGKLSKLYSLAKVTSGPVESLIAKLAMNAAVVQRRTKELNEKRGKGRPIEYCSVEDINVAREWAKAHRAHPPPSELYPPEEELTKLDLKLVNSVVVPHHFVSDSDAFPIAANASPASTSNRSDTPTPGAAGTPAGPSAVDNVLPPAAADLPAPPGSAQEEDIVLPPQKGARRSSPLSSPYSKCRRTQPQAKSQMSTRTARTGSMRSSLIAIRPTLQ
jgi:hypothetical protein